MMFRGDRRCEYRAVRRIRLMLPSHGDELFGRSSESMHITLVRAAAAGAGAASFIGPTISE